MHVHAGEPPVSVIIAVRDEAEALERKIASLRSLDYPASHLQIIVVSDGAGTPTRRSCGAASVDAIYVRRGGKAQALNAGVEAAWHDILVFADVRQRFDRHALHGLVAPLADPTVGGVSGELMLDVETGGRLRRYRPRALGGYWRYEKWLRRQESTIGSTMGATGAIYALRRSLWRPLPADTILDDVLAPMRAVLAASRVVFSSEALAFDPVAPSGVELRRKIRTLAGNYQILTSSRGCSTRSATRCGSMHVAQGRAAARALCPDGAARHERPAGDLLPVLRARLRCPGRLLRPRRLRRLPQSP